MRLAIFGASGKVGRLVVKEALSRGHSVNAFTHSSASLPGESDLPHPENLTIIQGDIHDPENVRAAVDGCDAVLSALGSWGTKSKDIVSVGTSNIIKAMQHARIERVVTLTGTEARDSADRPSLFSHLTHTGARIAAGKILHDGEEHIRRLRNSGLDWTVLRSPVMTDSPEIFYRLTLKPMSPWQTIPRKAIAKAMLDQIEGPSYSQASPYIYNQRSRF